MQEIQGNMDDVLSRNDLRDDEKTTRYFQLQNRYLAFKVTRPSFFFGGGYHPTLKLSGIPTFTFIASLTHRMDDIYINLQYNIKFLAIGVNARGYNATPL